MSFPSVIAIAVGLALDATAVACATSLRLGRVTARQVFRFAFHFGLFQGLMPVAGWFAGRTLAHVIGAWDHWVAFALLAGIGGHMIYEAFTGGGGDGPADPTRGLSLIALSVATSIDALAVGLSLALIGAAIWYPALAIGVVTALLTLIGMLAGARLGLRFGKRIGAVGGVVLIGIGVKILVEHLGLLS